MDPVEILLDEFREFRREARSDMANIWEAVKDGHRRNDERMTKMEVEQGKQKVRTGIIGTLAGVVAGVAARLF